MSKKMNLFMVIVLYMMMVSGCGNAIPKMNDQESDLVVQYAAQTLLSHTKEDTSRLVDTATYKEEKKETLSDAVKLPSAETEEDTIDKEETQEPSLEAQEEQTNPTIPVSTVLGISGVDIALDGYEVCDSYPNDSSSDALYFAMHASLGNKLVVLHVKVKNTTGEDVVFDTIALRARYRMILNATHKVNTLVTMLENDFAAQNTTITPGASLDTVLIAEVTKEMADTLTRVSLKVKNGDEETTCE